jgi:hypothetical protein
MNKMMSMFLKGLTGALMVFGLSGHATANNCLSYNATFSGSIGSQTSCGDYGMGGCVIGAGGSSCTYTGTTCDFEVVATPKVGRSSDKTTTFSVTNPGSSKPTCQVKMAFTQGNQGANYCQNVYPSGVSGDTLTTLGSKGTAVSHKQLEVCSDEVVVILSPPVTRITKTVVRVIDGVINCSEATDSLEVIAPAEVAYCYLVRNDGQSDLDGTVLIDDNGTPDDFSDDTEINDIGTLAGGASVMRDSGAITVTDTGEVVNTATVSGLHQGVACDTCSDSDTATLTVAVACDSSTQVIANATGTVVESSSVDGTTRCGPELGNTSGDATQSVALLCDGSCELKPECKNSPISCLQPCKPSLNWVYQVGNSNVCVDAEPGDFGSGLPRCVEVMGNPSNTFSSTCDTIIENPSVVQATANKWTLSRNPLLYYFPSSGGGDSTGTIYCILLQGENASVCPSGAFVY